MYLFRLLTALLGLLHYMVHGYHFQVNVYQGEVYCADGDLKWVLEDDIPAGSFVCFANGGNSFWTITSGGCLVQTWSGTNCEGSSSALTGVDTCQLVKFGSVKVIC